MRSSGEIRADIDMTTPLAKAERSLRASSNEGHELFPTVKGMSLRLVTLRDELEAALERERVENERARRDREQNEDAERGERIVRAHAELAGRVAALHDAERERERLMEERAQLERGEAVRRFTASDDVANRAGVGGVWSQMKPVFARGGDWHAHPAMWMARRGALLDEVQGASWPAALQFGDEERAEVVRWHALADPIVHARFDVDNKRANADALLDECPELRAVIELQEREREPVAQF